MLLTKIFVGREVGIEDKYSYVIFVMTKQRKKIFYLELGMKMRLV